MVAFYDGMTFDEIERETDAGAFLYARDGFRLYERIAIHERTGITLIDEWAVEKLKKGFVSFERDLPNVNVD